MGELCILDLHVHGLHMGVLDLQKERFTLIQNETHGSPMPSLRDLRTSDADLLGICVLVKKSVRAFGAFLPNFLSGMRKQAR